MAHPNFPSNPEVGDTYESPDGQLWVWNLWAWVPSDWELYWSRNPDTGGDAMLEDLYQIFATIDALNDITVGEGNMPAGGSTSQALLKASGASYDVAWTTVVLPSRQVATGTGLTGGGNLTINRTLALNSESIVSLGLADTALQPGDGLADLDSTAATKLSGIEALADVTDATNVAAAGAVMTTGNQTVGGTKTFSSDVLVPDEAYGSGWNGSLEVPTKNAVYDKIEALDLSGGGEGEGTWNGVVIDYIQDTEPSEPDDDDLWLDTTDFSLYIYFNDGDSSQWVAISGPQGAEGPPGAGEQGDPGYTAYEVAVLYGGFSGTVEEWLASLVGPPGENGTNGENGENGADGEDAYPVHSVSWSQTGEAETASGQHRLYNDSGADRTISLVRASVGTAPTGTSLIVDVNLDGTTIFSTQGNRPTISASGFTATGTPDVTEWADGEYLTVDVDQIGGTLPGEDLTVTVTYVQEAD